MTTIDLSSCDVKVMLGHMALYGLAAITEEAGLAPRLRWTPGMVPRPRLELPTATAEQAATAVLDHARRHAHDSWVQRDVEVGGTRRGLMSPRLTPFMDDKATRENVQQQRQATLSELTDQRRLLDLRMLTALGEPCYWSRNAKDQPLQDDGASRLEMQPRNQGSEFVGSRLRKLAETVAARDEDTLLDGLTGKTLRDEAGGDGLASRTATGFANPGPTDNALAWCALWGISQLPTVPRTNATALTSGHLGRSRREWFYLPNWTDPWRPARLRTILASRTLRTAAAADLPQAADPAHTLAARSWLSARGIHGIIRFPIERFGSDSAPERRAMLGQPLPTAPA